MGLGRLNRVLAIGGTAEGWKTVQGGDRVRCGGGKGEVTGQGGKTGWGSSCARNDEERG